MHQQRPKIVVTCSAHARTLDALQHHADVVVNWTGEPWSREQMIDQARGAFGLVAFMTDAVDEDFLLSCPTLRIIAGAFKGYDNIDVDACSRQGVWLSVIPDLLSAPTADLTIGLLLGLSRNLLEGDRLVREGRHRGWRQILAGTGLTGTTVGILGMGALGQAIAQRLFGFGCRIVYSDLRPLVADQEARLGLACLEIEPLAAESDILILALPLNERTRQIVDARFLNRIKRGCLLINPARGSLVDEEAIADALETGCLGGYAADVFAFEDISLSDRPKAIPARLLSNTQRTLFTPHIGSAISAVRDAIVLEAAMNIIDCLRGEHPRGAVNSIAMISAACS